MNFLAHLYFAEESPDSMIGNLMADFLRGLPPEEASAALRHGIELHRKIDRYTDSHPVVRESKALFNPPHRRYAGIALDVVYDHFLARDWSRYSALPLETFAGRAYEVMAAYPASLPEGLESVLRRMAAEDWLVSYREPERLPGILRRIGLRMRRENRLEEAAGELFRNYEELRAGFHRFFPELREYVASLPAVPGRESREGYNTASPRTLPR